MIRISRVSKTYGRRRALTDVTLEISRGECLAVVGPGGSGRSTLLRTLATLTPPSAGHVILDGVDIGENPFAVRRRLFFAGDGCRIADISVREYLGLIAAARGVRLARGRVDAVATLAGVSASAYVSELAGSDRRKLGMAAAAVSGADVLLLDELFPGCEAAAGEPRVSLLLEARKRGATIVATGSTDAELHGMCDRVVHLNEGRIWL